MNTLDRKLNELEVAGSEPYTSSHAPDGIIGPWEYGAETERAQGCAVRKESVVVGDVPN